MLPMAKENSFELHGTTILSLRKQEKVVIVGDGQVSLGNTIFKNKAKKVRRIFHNQVLVGFAGSTADAFTLFDRFEGKLEESHGNLQRAAVELAKDWRTNRMFRNLQAMLIVADKESTYILSGSGDVIEPEEGIAAIGSGGLYALSAAKALMGNTTLSAQEIAFKSMEIAAEICVFTNRNFTLEEI